MIYYAYYKNSSTNQPITGLACIWAFLINAADGSPYLPQPDITEIGNGYYAFAIVPATDLIGRIDGGPGLPAADRYADVRLGPADAYLETINGKFHIPAYTGPVAVIPAPPAANLQTLYGYAKELGTVWSAGTVVKVTPAKRQVINDVLIRDITHTVTVGADGSFLIYVDKGAKVRFEIGDFKTDLTITTDDTRNFADYLTGI